MPVDTNTLASLMIRNNLPAFSDELKEYLREGGRIDDRIQGNIDGFTSGAINLLQYAIKKERGFQFETHRLEVVKLLVDMGAKVNYPSNRKHVSPLVLAIQYNRKPIAEFLLSIGANIHQDSLTCFHLYSQRRSNGRRRWPPPQEIGMSIDEIYRMLKEFDIIIEQEEDSPLNPRVDEHNKLIDGYIRERAVQVVQQTTLRSADLFMIVGNYLLKSPAILNMFRNIVKETLTPATPEFPARTAVVSADKATQKRKAGFNCCCCS